MLRQEIILHLDGWISAWSKEFIQGVFINRYQLQMSSAGFHMKAPPNHKMDVEDTSGCSTLWRFFVNRQKLCLHSVFSYWNALCVSSKDALNALPASFPRVGMHVFWSCVRLFGAACTESTRMHMYDKQKGGLLKETQCRRSGRGWKTPQGTSSIYLLWVVCFWEMRGIRSLH